MIDVERLAVRVLSVDAGTALSLGVRKSPTIVQPKILSFEKGADLWMRNRRVEYD